jgi:hypothetical protein
MSGTADREVASNVEDVVIFQCRFICMHANASSNFKACPLCPVRPHRRPVVDRPLGQFIDNATCFTAETVVAIDAEGSIDCFDAKWLMLFG